MHFLVHLLCSSGHTEGRKEILARACNPCWVVSWTGAASYGRNSGTKLGSAFRQQHRYCESRVSITLFQTKKKEQMLEQVIFWHFNQFFHKVFHPKLEYYTLTIIIVNLILAMFQPVLVFFPTA